MYDEDYLVLKPTFLFCHWCIELDAVVSLQKKRMVYFCMFTLAFSLRQLMILEP